MGSVTSEGASDRCGSYSPSADVSESEASSEFSVQRFSGGGRGGGGGGASSLMASSPISMKTARAATATMADADVVFWEGEFEKRETEFNDVKMMKERFAKLLLEKIGLVEERESALLLPYQMPLPISLVTLVIYWFVAALVCCGFTCSLGYLSTELVFLWLTNLVVSV